MCTLTIKYVHSVTCNSNSLSITVYDSLNKHESMDMRKYIMIIILMYSNDHITTLFGISQQLIANKVLMYYYHFTCTNVT